MTDNREDVGAALQSLLIGGSRGADLIVDRPPLLLLRAQLSMARCVARTAVMLARREIAQPTEHVDRMLRFDDNSVGRVYRETIVLNARKDDMAILVVSFRLRWVRGFGHRVFRAASLLNTPLFVGFPGFVSKLWVAADGDNVYRGVYEWDGPERADAYARALWWVLALVSERRSIHYVVLPGVCREELLSADGPAEAVL